jgi:hypothetical protein
MDLRLDVRSSPRARKKRLTLAGALCPGSATGPHAVHLISAEKGEVITGC